MKHAHLYNVIYLIIRYIGLEASCIVQEQHARMYYKKNIFKSQ